MTAIIQSILVFGFKKFALIKKFDHFLLQLTTGMVVWKGYFVKLQNYVNCIKTDGVAWVQASNIFGKCKWVFIYVSIKIY